MYVHAGIRTCTCDKLNDTFFTVMLDSCGIIASNCCVLYLVLLAQMYTIAPSCSKMIVPVMERPTHIYVSALSHFLGTRYLSTSLMVALEEGE